MSYKMYSQVTIVNNSADCYHVRDVWVMTTIAKVGNYIIDESVPLSHGRRKRWRIDKVKKSVGKNIFSAVLKEFFYKKQKPVTSTALIPYDGSSGWGLE